MLSDDICSNCENKLSGCRREVEWYNSTPICRGFVERQAHISESDFDKMQKEAADMHAELAALKEKYRWHDSRAEKIPQSVSILHCPVYEIRAVLPCGSSHLFEAVMIAENLICVAKNFDYYYWRLLDELPKEDVRP